MKKTRIEEAINRKYPQWVTMLVTADEEGVPNAMPASWCMFTSHQPPMMAVSVAFKRYTYKLMENGEDFVITFPSKEQKEGTYYSGRNSGANVNKFEETDLETAPASKIKTPIIEDSVACFECKKKGSLQTGDHTVFAGEIVAAHVSEDNREKFYAVKGWHERGASGFQTISEITGS